MKQYDEQKLQDEGHCKIVICHICLICVGYKSTDTRSDFENVIYKSTPIGQYTELRFHLLDSKVKVIRRDQWQLV